VSQIVVDSPWSASLPRPGLSLRLEDAPDGPTLHVGGRLPRGWCVNLCTGLAQRHVDIRRGRASTDGAGSWNAWFMLDRRLQAPLDELESLITTDRSVSIARLPAIVLHEWTLARDASGALQLSIAGPDRTGLMAALLKRLAYFSLFARELALDGWDGNVRDRLWLYEPGGRTPSQGAEAALRDHLPLITRDE